MYKNEEKAFAKQAAWIASVAVLLMQRTDSTNKYREKFAV